MENIRRRGRGSGSVTVGGLTNGLERTPGGHLREFETSAMIG